MEDNKNNTMYRAIMLVIITAIVTFMVTSIGMYKYFIKTDDGNIKILSKKIELSNEGNTIANKIELIKKYLQKYYIGELNPENMEEMAIKGYVAGLGDEYTEYLTKDEYEDLLVSVTGDFVGIGIYMAQDNDGNVVVLMPMENSPAEDAGIEAGDIIVSVDGESCKNVDLNVVSSKIKGEEKTKVALEILRENETIQKTIERRTVEIKNSESKVLDGNIGYIIFTTFDEKCAEQIEKYLKEFETQGIKSVIIDTRNNTGGIVTEAIKISELFIEKGNVIMRTYDKDKKETVIESTANSTFDMNVILLVNDYSASATEILAAALKDNHAATIVGTKTYGKGVMQEIREILNGAIKITIEEFKTPNGENINKIGITPDVEVEDDETTEEDEQLQRAIELLK